MKKKVLLLGSVAILTFSLVACSGNDAKKEVKEEVKETQEVAKEEVKEVKEEAKTEEKEIKEEEHTHGVYEWMGEFELKAGTYLFHFGESLDETMEVGFIKMGDNIADLEHHAEHLMDIEDKEVIEQESEFIAKPDYAYNLKMAKDHGHVNFVIEEDGRYAIVTEHLPSESTMQIFNADQVEILPDVEHEGPAH